MNKYDTPQEEFWAGDFGDSYITRNNSPELLASNIVFFSKALARAGQIFSCIEFGTSIGMNLKALRLLYPKMLLKGVEINTKAVKAVSNLIGRDSIYEGSIFDYNAIEKFDLVLVKGILIHVNPGKLSHVYDKLYASTKKYILVCEYYSPNPVNIIYRGHKDRLFKRDFAGEILKRYADLELVDYGFVYKNDPTFPQDDITWFLLKK